MKIETLAIHAGHEVDSKTGAITPPLYLSTTFERDIDGELSRGFMYTRVDNPNRKQLEECVSQLEGGERASAFSSGSAATMSVFQALKPGDHVIAPDDAYHGTSHMLKSILKDWGLDFSFVDMTQIAKVKAAIKSNTQLIFTETPSNPLLKVTDLRQVSDLAHEHGALSVCDNTWATPILQRPFEQGVDVVIHSSTKYMGGHSDVLGGVVIFKEQNDFYDKVKNIQASAGAVPSPFDSWLILRGIQTMPYRIRSHSDNALKMATFLNEHGAVSKVNYPGLKEHPGHLIAQNQMSQFGGMLSFEIIGDKEKALNVVAGTRLFKRATSLGGVESLIEHRASVEGPDTKTPQNLIRVSVGLEHIDDLIQDIDKALDQING